MGGVVADDQWLGDEAPTARADVELVRETTGIYLDGSVWPPRGKFRVTTSGSASSPASAASTMLLLVTTACVPAVLIGVTGGLVHLPALALAGAVLGVFTAVFVTCTVMVFRTGKQRSETGSLPPVYIFRPLSGRRSNGSALPRSAGAGRENGHAGEGRAAHRGRQIRPRRR